MGRTHLLSGAASFVAAIELGKWLLDRQFNPSEILVGTAVCAGAALLPDTDQERSTASLTFSVLSQAVARIIGKISGGHREATHSLLGIGAFTGLAWLLLNLRGNLIGQVLFVHFLSFLLGACMRALHMKAFKRDHLVGLGNYLVSTVIAYGLTRFNVGLSVIPLAVGFGVYIHILWDSCTDSGCPILWPLPIRFHVIPKRLRWSTGAKDGFPVEPILSVVFSAVTIAASVHLVATESLNRPVPAHVARPEPGETRRIDGEVAVVPAR